MYMLCRVCIRLQKMMALSYAEDWMDFDYWYYKRGLELCNEILLTELAKAEKK